MTCTQCLGEKFIEEGWGWPWSCAVGGLAQQAGYACRVPCPRCAGTGIEPEGLPKFVNPLTGKGDA